MICRTEKGGLLEKRITAYVVSWMVFVGSLFSSGALLFFGDHSNRGAFLYDAADTAGYGERNKLHGKLYLVQTASCVMPLAGIRVCWSRLYRHFL